MKKHLLHWIHNKCNVVDILLRMCEYLDDCKAKHIEVHNIIDQRLLALENRIQILDEFDRRITYLELDKGIAGDILGMTLPEVAQEYSSKTDIKITITTIYLSLIGNFAADGKLVLTGSDDSEVILAEDLMIVPTIDLSKIDSCKNITLLKDVEYTITFTGSDVNGTVRSKSVTTKIVAPKLVAGEIKNFSIAWGNSSTFNQCSATQKDCKINSITASFSGDFDTSAQLKMYYKNPEDSIEDESKHTLLHTFATFNDFKNTVNIAVNATKNFNFDISSKTTKYDIFLVAQDELSNKVISNIVELELNRASSAIIGTPTLIDSSNANVVSRYDVTSNQPVEITTKGINVSYSGFADPDSWYVNLYIDGSTTVLAENLTYSSTKPNLSIVRNITFDLNRTYCIGVGCKNDGKNQTIGLSDNIVFSIPKYIDSGILLEYTADPDTDEPNNVELKTLSNNKKNYSSTVELSGNGILFYVTVPADKSVDSWYDKDEVTNISSYSESEVFVHTDGNYYKTYYYIVGLFAEVKNFVITLK